MVLFMHDLNANQKFNLDSPAIYSIKVQGELDPKWSGRFKGMQITSSKEPEDQIITMLVGKLQDQAALAGVLDMIYNLRLPVLSVDCLEKL